MCDFFSFGGDGNFIYTTKDEWVLEKGTETETHTFSIDEPVEGHAHHAAQIGVEALDFVHAVGYAAYYKADIESCKANIERCKADIERYKAAIEGCKAGIERYKADIERYKVLAQKWEATEVRRTT